jgi:hypothetical protein
MEIMTMMIMKSVSYFLITLLLLFFTNNTSNAERLPFACTSSDPTEIIGPLNLVVGTSYEKLSEHVKDCATEGKNGVCNCHVTIESALKYRFEGSAQVSWFGLAAGWETETTATAEDTKNLTTTTSGECVGPMWGYLKRDFQQKCKIKVPKNLNNHYCTPCNSQVSTLYRSPYVTCAYEEHEEFEPSLKSGNAICTDAPQ